MALSKIHDNTCLEPMRNYNTDSKHLKTFLNIFRNDDEYNKTKCQSMKLVIFREIREHKYFANKLDHANSYLYFIRIRKNDGNLYKIGITHNRLTNRIITINNGDFKGVNYRIIIIGCMRIRGNTFENYIKKKLKFYEANKYERVKRSGNLSTESYRVSYIVYQEIKHIFDANSPSMDRKFWSTEYKISNNDRETYYDVELCDNVIYMED